VTDEGRWRVCSTCAHYRPDPDVPGGECRAHPPSIDMIPLYHDSAEDVTDQFPGNEDGSSIGTVTFHSVEQVDVTRRGIWPYVGPDDWCGEWKEIG
jgi:hypothetical protein